VTVELRKLQELRAQTGAGVLDCRRALEAAGGDVRSAAAALAAGAERAAAAKAHRDAGAGLAQAYVHADGRIAALIEVRCETDFLARTAAFRALVRDLLLQITASAPDYVAAEDVPAEVLAELRRSAEETARGNGKPERIVQEIIRGKERKYLQRACLLQQAFIKDPTVTVRAWIERFAAGAGENVRVRRFARFELPHPAHQAP